MWKIKFLEWLKYTVATIKTKNKFLPMAIKLDKIALSCLKEIEKTDNCKSILTAPELTQFFWSPYTTALNYHEAITSASLSQYSLNSFSLVRPQLEAALIFLYFIDSENENELISRVGAYHDWVVVKMHDNAHKSNEFEYIQHLSTHEDFMHKIDDNYKLICEKYINREADLKKLNRASFIRNKRKLAIKYNIEGLFLHIQSEASASIHIADVSDRTSYETIESNIFYTYNKNNDDSFWMLMLSNLVQFHIIKNTADYFNLGELIKEQLKNLTKKSS